MGPTGAAVLSFLSHDAMRAAQVATVVRETRNSAAT